MFAISNKQDWEIVLTLTCHLSAEKCVVYGVMYAVQAIVVMGSVAALPEERCRIVVSVVLASETNRECYLTTSCCAVRPPACLHLVPSSWMIK